MPHCRFRHMFARHVVNYDFPSNLEQYCHRIGRVGRSGEAGARRTGGGTGAVARPRSATFRLRSVRAGPRAKGGPTGCRALPGDPVAWQAAWLTPGPVGVPYAQHCQATLGRKALFGAGLCQATGVHGVAQGGRRAAVPGAGQCAGRMQGLPCAGRPGAVPMQRRRSRARAATRPQASPPRPRARTAPHPCARHGRRGPARPHVVGAARRHTLGQPRRAVLAARASNRPHDPPTDRPTDP